MTKDDQADLLSAKLNKEIKENDEFLADIDQQIKEADLEYTQALIEEEKGFLKLAKKSLENKDN